MKNLLLLSLSFFCFHAFSQTQKNGSAVIDYKMTNNTALPNALDATLYIDNNTTIFFEKYSTQVYGESTIEGLKSPTTPTRKFIFEPYTRIDHNNKKVEFFETIKTNVFLVSDSFNQIEWSISDETKDISGYPCIKATADFRGRTWTAWYTPDIPLPYGPWKLHGLPGLIMEAQDSTKTYIMNAERIEYRRDEIFDKDFRTMHPAKNENPITYKQYLQDYKEYRDNTRAELEAKYNTQYQPATKRNGKELSFEWEE